MDHQQDSIPEALVTPRIVDNGQTTEIELTTTGTQTLYEIILDIHYDADLYSVRSVELGEPLGGRTEVLTLAATGRPGLVALGQVRTGLREVPVPAGLRFAKVTFDNAPAREVSTPDVELPGRKLRSNVEFQGADVAFRVEEDPNSPSTTVTWEEANDGDYDNNSEVNSSDLTELGMRYTDELDVTVDYDVDPNYSAPGDPATFDRSVPTVDLGHNLSIRNIGAKGQTVGYAPVVRKKANYNLKTDPDIYLPNITDISVIGANIDNVVVGYDVYLLDVPTGQTPTATNYLDAVRLTKTAGGAWAPLLRPEPDGSGHFTESLTALGMGDFAPRLPGQPLDPDPSYTYQQFCEHDCSAVEDRGTGNAGVGFTPLPEDKRIYKFRFDRPASALGDAYLAVVPLESREAEPVEGTLGAFTYYPQALAITPLAQPSGITWDDNIVGITDLEKTDENGNPDEDGLGFRIKWGTATLASNPDGLWEVRYGVFFSFIDADDDLFETDLDPHSYPMRYRVYPRTAVLSAFYTTPCVDVKDADKQPDDYYYFVSNGSIINQTLRIAVRAYAWHPTPHGSGIRSSLDLNTTSLSAEFSEPLIVDDQGPSFKGMKFDNLPFNVWVSQQYPFRPVYGLTTRTPGADSFGHPIYEIDYLRVPHPDGTNGEYGPAVFVPAYFLMDDLHDIDGSGLVRPDATVKVRLEIYRTIKSQAYCQTYLQTHTIKELLDSGDVTLYNIAMTWPEAKSNYVGHPANLLNDNYFWDHRDTIDYDATLFTFCPPLQDPITDDLPAPVNHGFRRLDGTDDYLKWTVDSNFPVLPVDYYTPMSVLDGNGHPQSVGINEPHYDVRFVYHDTLEFDGEGHQYSYFVVAAAADELHNTTYDSDSGADQQLTWLGRIPDYTGVTFIHEPIFAGNEKSYRDYDDYEMRSYVRNDGFNFQDHAYRQASTPPDFTVHYPDMAINPVNGAPGMSFFDPTTGLVRLRELNPSTNVWTISTVDLGADGDTSLTYDSSGNPHVAYFAVGLPDPVIIVDPPPVDPGTGPGTGGNFHTGSSTDPALAGVHYRKRVSGIWQPRETVNRAGLHSWEEHSIHLDHQGRPFVILATDATGGTKPLGVPGCVVRTGTAVWTKYVIPVANGLTGKYLDSDCVVGGGATTCRVLIHDVLADDLLLATGYEGLWRITPLGTGGDVAGYQSLVRLPGGSSLGISYMSATDNKLVYGTWNGLAWTQAYVSGQANVGFQSELALDSLDRPLALSVNRDTGTLWLTWFDGTNYHEKEGPPIFADKTGGLDVLRTNTVRCIPTATDNVVTGMLPNSGICFAHIEIAP